MYSQMSFNKRIHLCNQNHSLRTTVSPTPHTRQPLICFLSIDVLPYSRTSQDQTIKHVFFCVWFPSLFFVFEIHLHRFMYQSSVLLQFHGMRKAFLQSPVRHWGSFPVWGSSKYSCYKISVKVFVWTDVFISHLQIPTSRIARSW